MSDHAQVKALAEDLAQSPAYSLHIANLRQEIIRQVERAPAIVLDAVASTLGIRGGKP